MVAVDKQSDAYVHGLDVGDVIERVQGRKAESPDQVYALARQASTDHRFVAVLIRWTGGTRWVSLRVGSVARSGPQVRTP